MQRLAGAACQPAALAAFVLLLVAPAAWALEFEMLTQTKCIYEEINANVLVVGDYKAFNKDNTGVPVYVDVRVRIVMVRSALQGILLLIATFAAGPARR